jgi:hypothetical protein
MDWVSAVFASAILLFLGGSAIHMIYDVGRGSGWHDGFEKGKWVYSNLAKKIEEKEITASEVCEYLQRKDPDEFDKLCRDVAMRKRLGVRYDQR